MKKRRIPAILLGVLLMAEFIREYPWIAAFAGIWLALTLGWIAHDMIKDRRNRKRSEEAQAEAEEAARNRRNRKYQKSRYTPEDRAALEAHIQEKLGPVIRLDRETESAGSRGRLSLLAGGDGRTGRLRRGMASGGNGHSSGAGLGPG